MLVIETFVLNFMKMSPVSPSSDGNLIEIHRVYIYIYIHIYIYHQNNKKRKQYRNILIESEM
uniref:Uncharacterized protein n=1 Tax=Octopus bimaculoides TaxID=37653 RepID=A0A0L8H333_OCTBM